MSLMARAVLVLALLIAALAGQQALLAYLDSAGPPPPGELAAPLAELPLELGEWRGADRSIDDERLLYADQHLQRVYVHRRTGQQAMLWIAYSTTGEDRGHHPEVCMAVAGQPEDRQSRRTLEVAGHAAPVQVYRYGFPGRWQQVFYWHYTLPSPREEEEPVRKLYHRLRQSPASVTLEVFAPEMPALADQSESAGAAELVELVDAAIQAHVGPRAVRGSSRKPVTMVDNEPPPTN